MTQIHERLREAVDQQRRLASRRRPGSTDAAAEAAFAPVRDAASELRDVLSHVPELRLGIAPDSVWIELYDRHLWFGYDANERAFIGIEQDTKWMEGGLREASYRWDTAEACIEAMVQACARYVWLAEAIARFRTGR